MTKNEARQCVMDNYHIVTQGCDLGLCGRDKDADAFEEAIDILLDAPSIAQSIRDAAVNWPRFVDDWTAEILHGADDHSGDWSIGLLPGMPEHEQFTSRTFMLFVAEALE